MDDELLNLNALFVCSQGRMRSKTAAHCLKDIFKRTDYAGTDVDAAKPITQDDIDWADMIFLMDSDHLYRISESGLDIGDKPWVVLAIPDIYIYMEDELVFTLRARVPRMAKTLLD